jgi:hypothetical protein
MTHLPRPSDCNSGSVRLALMPGCQKMRLGKIPHCDLWCYVPNHGWLGPGSNANANGNVYVRCLRLCVCKTCQSERHTLRQPAKAANRHPYCDATRRGPQRQASDLISGEQFCTLQASEEDFLSDCFYTDSFPHVHNRRVSGT